MTWVDSIGLGGWQSVPEEYDVFANQSIVCTTVGYLCGRKKDRLVLAMNIGVGGANRGHLVIIPRAAVRKIRRL